MKKMIALSLVTCISLSNAITSYAENIDSQAIEITQVQLDEAVSKVSNWAGSAMKLAYNRNLIKFNSFEKSSDVITREEFCEILVAVYADIMNEKPTITTENTFTDTENEDVLIAVEIGLMAGVSETEFNPDAFLTREELAVNLVNVLELLSVDLNKYIVENPFPDINNLKETSIEDIKKLYGVKVLSGDANGNFVPERNVTTEEAVMACINTLWCYETTRNHQVLNVVSQEDQKIDVEETFTDEQLETIFVNDKAVYLGQKRESLVGTFGEPNRIDSTVYVLDRYVYHDNYDNYFFVTFVNDEVKEIFVPSASYKYLDFDGNINKNNLLKYFDNDSEDYSKIISDTTTANIFIDYNSHSTGILLQDEMFVTGEYATITSEMKELSCIEPVLLDLLQVKRKEVGVDLLQENTTLKSVAMKHANDMWWADEISTTGLDGRNPFQRISDAGIEYTMATELIDYQYGDIVNFYDNLISSPANFATILSSQYKYVGIGVMQKDYHICMVIDLCN